MTWGQHMGTAAQPTREHRTMTVDFRSEATYCQLLGEGKAVRECVLAFVMSLGFPRKHKATCRGGGCLTRHSPDVRVRRGGVSIWRIPCTTCTAGFTVLPPFIWRDRQMRPEGARHARLATPGGLRLERCAVLCHLSPLALYRWICAGGHPSLVTGLTRCGLPLPPSILVDAQHRHCLTAQVYLPTIVCGRIIWPLGDTENASAAALTQSYGGLQRAASRPDPTSRVRGMLSDGFDSTTQSMRLRFPGARLGTCLRHALNQLAKTLAAIASPVRKAWRSQFHTLLYRVRQRQG